MAKGKSKISVAIIIIAIILVIAIAALAGIIVYKEFFEEKNAIDLGTDVIKDENEPIVIEEKEVQIFKGEDRPIAVMIDNSKSALPHAGLNKAYMIYEAIVEGGETRLMALFKGVNLEKIGPVRSSRHYFLDFAMENDAIYVHYGWSPQAQSDISTYGINNINGVTNDSTYFWRVKDKVSPHNAVISTTNILKAANDKGYKTTSTVSSVLNYNADGVDLSQKYATTVETADKITIPFSTGNKVVWEYDSENKGYKRYTKGVQEVEWDSKEEYLAKNIILEFIKNEPLNDGEGKDRQTMTTIGTKEGYYITEGKAIKITCEKTTRRGQTVYKDMDGNEIEVNDGNTFVEICPTTSNVTIEANETTENTENVDA